MYGSNSTAAHKSNVSRSNGERPKRFANNSTAGGGSLCEASSLQTAASLSSSPRDAVVASGKSFTPCSTTGSPCLHFEKRPGFLAASYEGVGAGEDGCSGIDLCSRRRSQGSDASRYRLLFSSQFSISRDRNSLLRIEVEHRG